MIKFGTDGWRAVVGRDFNKENVTNVVNAIKLYVVENFGPDKKILVGYDPRNQAKEFAQFAADILSGFDVELSSRVVPTPALAFSAKAENACAIMFTASHNPPEYLGIKFIPDYAGPATDDITAEIVSHLNSGSERPPGKPVKLKDFSKPYFKHIEKLIDFEKIRTWQAGQQGKIIFDGLYSASIGYFDELLRRNGIGFESLHMEHDPNFGGGMPEPKPKYLSELILRVKALSGAAACGRAGKLAAVGAVGFANDGDADRFGVINEDGKYVSPNELIAILLIHLKKNKGLDSPLVKTVGASLLLDETARRLGVEVIETAVGFKHVGEAMRKYDALIGGEESGGLSIKGHIPEKDGILANLLILEAMAYENKTLVQLQKDLYDFVQCRFYSDRLDKHLSDPSEAEPLLEKYVAMNFLGDFKITCKDTQDGIKLYFDNGWVLIRPSGTEPLLRIYFESSSEDDINKLKEIFYEQ